MTNDEDMKDQWDDEYESSLSKDELILKKNDDVMLNINEIQLKLKEMSSHLIDQSKIIKEKIKMKDGNEFLYNYIVHLDHTLNHVRFLKNLRIQGERLGIFESGSIPENQMINQFYSYFNAQKEGLMKKD